MLRLYVVVCCIYHKPRAFDESSSSGSDSSESDTGGDTSDSQSAPSAANQSTSEPGEHLHSAKCSHWHKHQHQKRKKGSTTRQPGGSNLLLKQPNSGINAYEKQPTFSKDV